MIVIDHEKDIWPPSVYVLNQYQYLADGQLDTGSFTDRQDNFQQELRASSGNPQSAIQWPY